MTGAQVFTARDIMTTELVSVAPTTAIFDAIDLLLEHAISGAPVVDTDGGFCGVVSQMDCMRMLAVASYDEPAAEEMLQVAGHMSSDWVSIAPSDDIYHIVELFEKHPVGSFPVLDEGALVGIVARYDVIRGIKMMKSELLAQAGRDHRRGDSHKPGSFFGATRHDGSELAARLRR